MNSRYIQTVEMAGVLEGGDVTVFEVGAVFPGLAVGNLGESRCPCNKGQEQRLSCFLILLSSHLAELRFISHGVLADGVVSDDEKMGIAFIQGAKRLNTRLKTEFPEKSGISQNKKGAFLDGILAQGKAEQLRTDPLILHLRFHRNPRQMQPTDLCAVISIRKSNIGSDRIAMNTHPFMQSPPFFMKLIKQSNFILAPGKGLLQQSGNLGVIFRSEFTDFH